MKINLIKFVKKTWNSEKNFLLINSFIFISWSYYILGDYQNWGGDYAQYITQSRNLLWDRSFAFQMEGFPSIMPLYPLALYFISALFFESIFLFSLFNTICWLGLSLSVYLIISRFSLIQNKDISKVIYLVLLHNVYIYSYQQNITPIFLYSMLIWITLILFINPKQSNNSYFICIILFLFLSLTGLTRTTYLSFAITIFLCGLFFSKKLLILSSSLSLCFVFSVEKFLSINNDQITNFSVFFDFLQRSNDSTKLISNFDFLLFCSNVIRLFISYFNLLIESCLPLSSLYSLSSFNYFYSNSSGLVYIIHPLFIPFLFLFCMGSTCINRKIRFIFITYFILHLILISFFVQNTPIQRYVIPILPIFIIFVIIGFFDFYFKYLKNAKAFFITFILFLFISGISFYEKSFRKPYKSNTLSDELLQATSYIKPIISQYDQVAFFKPRVLTYLLDSEKSSSLDIISIRNLSLFRNWTDSQQKRLILLPKNLSSFGQSKIVSHISNSPNFEIIFSNDSYIAVQNKINN